MSPSIMLILNKGMHHGVMATSLILPSMGTLVAMYLRDAIQHVEQKVIKSAAVLDRHSKGRKL